MMIKRIKILFVILCLSGLVSVKSQAQRLVIIGLDGFSAEGYKTARHPNIDALVAEGILSLTTRPVMPSITLPNWTSHLSGAGPEEHGIVNNEWKLDAHELQALEKDQEGYYPNVFKLLKEQVPGIRIGYFYNWGKLINSMNQKYFDEISFEKEFKYRANYDKAYDYLLKNRNYPTTLFLYSVHTDFAGHDHKWMSPQYITAIEEADVAIGELLAKLKAADLYADTHFMLITDHGGLPEGHGGVSMTEMQVPWAVTGPKINKLGLVDFANSNKNTALVIAGIYNLKNLPVTWSGVLPKNILKKNPKNLKMYLR
ncbi:alkaline phosphatase family protein [Emticicia sp. 21SJ11W-3]|uniref:alkaline phosphatase family protein n=1 Tax=Emticicia sp. 21SJ11W-3 TaxID=2916755 RepID=UPI00209F9B20|nr:alkaline phosphatase family protein [Emticicia sp. 21SJ11W-3]UTA66855.1 alkaline phosphatase family protein [Emticicia sp. 21SJ11W-3]